jgi:hypothetical protein
MNTPGAIFLVDGGVFSPCGRPPGLFAAALRLMADTGEVLGARNGMRVPMTNLDGRLYLPLADLTRLFDQIGYAHLTEDPSCASDSGSRPECVERSRQKTEPLNIR